MKILVSACLLGENCKYNGGNNYNQKVVDFLKGHEVISVCPEMLGGLPAPRAACEILDGIVVGKDGNVYDSQFRSGARTALEQALAEGAQLAILQPRSPSCGTGIIYDGTFSGVKIPGSGVFSQMAQEAGIKTITADEIEG